jgi:hypothetical protein
MSNIDNAIVRNPRKSHILLRSIRLALATSAMAAALPAGAVLLDHGPGDAALSFPTWYRDQGNPATGTGPTALAMCKNVPNPATGALPQGTFCFPTPNDPAFFAGNIGPEAFYMDLNVNVTSAAVNLRYIAALEMAYGNAAGNPIRGQEIVFSRIRFVMNVISPSCTGDYTIKHPYGTYTNNVPGTGPRALFDTIDVPLGALGDFEGALQGNVGPFLMWDDGAGNPLNTTALRTAAGLTFNGSEFIGDPTILHTFTGSTFVNAADGTPQNYVEVTAPVGCDLVGLGLANPTHNISRVSVGTLLGQVFTAPIPTPTKVTKASFTRDNTNGNAVDVWAETATAQNLVLTANGLPSVPMKEDKSAAGVGTGNYHAHIEYFGAVPPTVTVTNTTSNPVSQSTGPLTDVVDITSATFDSASNTLCVTAHSEDQVGLPSLQMTGPHGGTLSNTDCPATFGAKPDPKDLSYSVVLPNGAAGALPITALPPSVEVLSATGGTHFEDVAEILPGVPDNIAGAPVAGDDAPAPIPNFGASTLTLGGNDSSTTDPLIIISQPATGTVTGSATGGTATFTPTSGSGPDSFTYVIQDPATKLVSNLATVQLNVTIAAPAPTGVSDNFAVVRNNGTALNVALFGNDAANGSAILPATFQVSASAAGPFTPVGTVTRVNVGTIASVLLNANGTVNVKGGTSAAGNYSFWYKVGNANGLSAATQVDLVLEAGNEIVTYARAPKFVASKGSWDVRPSSTWATVPAGPAPFGGMTANTTCYLVSIAGAPVAPKLIGGGPQPTAAVGGGALIQSTVTGAGWPASGQTFGVQCATSNAIAAFPSNSNTNSTPVTTATAN